MDFKRNIIDYNDFYCIVFTERSDYLATILSISWSKLATTMYYNDNIQGNFSHLIRLLSTKFLSVVKNMDVR